MSIEVAWLIVLLTLFLSSYCFGNYYQPRKSLVMKVVIGFGRVVAFLVVMAVTVPACLLVMYALSVILGVEPEVVLPFKGIL